MTLPLYKLPPLKPTETLLMEITFSGNVPGNSHQTFVAGPISQPFKIVKATMVFSDLAHWLAYYYFLVSSNSNGSTTDVPPDTNIFGLYSPSAFFIGNNLIRETACGFRIDETRQYIKFHVHNLNPAAVPVSASVQIMLKEA